MRPMRRLRWVICAALLACAAPPSQAARPDDGTIVSRAPAMLPAWDAAEDVRDKWSRADYDAAVADTSHVLERIVYRSDGLRVHAFLWRPRRVGAPRPAIVFNRGSYLRGDIAGELAPFCRRIAGDRFVVIAPMYRESDGAEGRDEVGGADLNDLLAVVPLARALGIVDTDRLFVYGESRGGMMVYQALRERMPVRAAAVFGAFTDLESLAVQHPKVYPPLFRRLWPDFERNGKSYIDRRSAIRWPDQLDRPLLIMHGGADHGVNPAQSLRLAEALQRLGRTYELAIFADDNHVLENNQVERDRRAVLWFERYMN